MERQSNLLIHHHAIAFVENEKIWIKSFIGVWVEELSSCFNEIGLLVRVSADKKIDQDYAITSQKVKVYRANPSHQVNLYYRNQYFRQVCKDISPQYDILLIRGFTPRQKLVFDSCTIRHKCFLLVGSLLDSKPTLQLSGVSLITWGFDKIRRRELRVISRSAQMFANSPAIVKEILTILGVKAGFMPTNTISKKDFGPISTRTIGSPIKLLFCGRVVKEKGIEELINAIKLLRDRNIDVQLDVVGSITEVYMSFLSNRINKMSLGSMIRFHGFISFGDPLLQYYRNSQIYILPSWHEGFPHSIWEAAATCTPVIITPVGGVTGILSSNHVLFCRAKDPNAIVDSIIECMADQDSTKTRVYNLYQLALIYTIEECVKTTYNLLAERLD